MAKSSRSSSRKANNQRLAAKVFGPAENARAERLSARLLEVAKQAKPETSDANMDVDSKNSSRLRCISFLSFKTDVSITAGAETAKTSEENQVNDNGMDPPSGNSYG
jgi:hypothetical protein